jgi:hypothetical protein
MGTSSAGGTGHGTVSWSVQRHGAGQPSSDASYSGFVFSMAQGVFVIVCALGDIDCVGQGRIGYVAEPLTKTVANWWCP